MAQHKTTFGGVLAAIPTVGAAMIAARWLIEAEAEPRIRLLFDHTVFRYRLRAA